MERRTFKVSLPGWVLWSWVLMLTLGMLHAAVPAVPALGYLPCAGIGAVLSLRPWESLASWEWVMGSSRPAPRAPASRWTGPRG